MRSAADASTTRLFLFQRSRWPQHPPRKSKPGSFPMFMRLVLPRSCLELCFAVVHLSLCHFVRVFPPFTPMPAVGNVIIEIVLERAEVAGEKNAREGRLEKFKVLSIAAI
jgi:hypothetical protein